MQTYTQPLSRNPQPRPCSNTASFSLEIPADRIPQSRDNIAYRTLRLAKEAAINAACTTHPPALIQLPLLLRQPPPIVPRPGLPRLLRLALPAGDFRHDVRQVPGEVLSNGGSLPVVIARAGVRGGCLPEKVFQVR